MEAADSEDFLRGLIDRTRRVRAALAELREQAFAAAALGTDSGCGPSGASPTWAASSGGAAAPPVQMLPVLLLPPGLTHGGALAPGTSMLSLGDSCGGGTGGPTLLQLERLLGPPADCQVGQCTGERHASPKTSRPQLWAGSPVGSVRRQREEQHPPAAGASSGASFEEVLAALRAEGLVQLPEGELAGQYGQLAHVSGSRPASRQSGSANGQQQAAAGAWRDSSWSLDGGSTPGRSQRPTHAQQQQRRRQQQAPVASGQAAPLPYFDPIEAERRLKAKLDQVHAAKRSREARAYPAGGSCGPTPRQPQAARGAPAGVPRLPLALLSRAGSTGGSKINSVRLSSSRENERPGAAAHAQQEGLPWQAQGGSPAGSPAAALQTASAALAMGDLPAAAEPGMNFLPSARDERGSCPTWADPAAPACPPQPPRKESRISLPQLLSPAPIGCSAAPQSASAPAVPLAVAESGSAGMRRSSFSVPDAASTAAAASAAGIASNANPDVAKPAAVAVGGEQAASTLGARALEAGGGVLPGEAAASPLQSTPQGLLAADGTPAAVRRTSRLGSGVAGTDQLRLQLSGKLQSPPATPLEVAAPANSAVTAGPEGRPRCEESPGKVSTASSGSPEQQQEQQQEQAAASPLHTFALPADEEHTLQQAAAACSPPPRQHAGIIEQQTPVQQQHGSLSIPAADQPAGGERSASSIGRKRANSEAGCSEGPASVKKRSPDVGSRGQLGACSRAEQQQAGRVAAAGTAWAAGAAAAEGEGEQKQDRQKELQGRQQPSGLSKPAGAAQPVQAAAPPAERTGTQSGRRSGSPTAGAGRLIIPVVLQHSPPQQRRRQQQHAAAEAPAAVAANGVAEPTKQQAPPASKPEAAGTAGTRLPKPAQLEQQQGQQQQQQQQQQQRQGKRGASAKPAAQARATAATGEDGAGANRPAPPPAVAAVRAAPPPVSVPLADAASPRQELPSLSQWVDARSDGLQQPEGRQHTTGSEELEMPSTSVLIGGDSAPQLRHSNRTAVDGKPGQQKQQQLEAPPPLAPAPPSLTPGGGDGAAAAAAISASGAAMAAAPVITPRRRASTLEPPEAVLCLREDAYGKQLLETAPKLAGMPAGDLLAAAAQGCVVRKAWVRPNFKQGGSTRSIQLASGSGGRVEMLYPSGLLRRPLRFAVRRAVVPLSTWRPGQYIVLDTARGMLRLEPGSTADHARWVLALNAAFLASGAPPASSGAGSLAEADGSGAWRRLAVRDLKWSAAILLS